jgi:hypothetical protein
MGSYLYVCRDYQEAALVRIDSAGSVQWEQSYPQQGEVTDVAVAPDESYYVMTGHTSYTTQTGSWLLFGYVWQIPLLY